MARCKFAKSVAFLYELESIIEKLCHFYKVQD